MPARHELPLYLQISEMLIRDIQSGRLREGERLAPERDLAETYGISVGTVRKALAELSGKGLLHRRQGSGNYIRAADGPSGIYAFFRLELPRGGGLPGAQLLSLETMEKPADLPPFGRSATAHRMRRLRSLNTYAVALEEIWLDASYAETLLGDDLSESLYLHYQISLDLWITKVEDRVGVGPPPAWAENTMEFHHSIVGRVDRKSWDQNGVIAEISTTWFDSEKCHYVSRG